MDKLLLKDEEYKIIESNKIQFILPYNIKLKNVGIVSQLPAVGIVYNGDCEGVRGTFDEDFQVLTLEKEGVDLGESELSIILLLYEDNTTANPLLESMNLQLMCLNSLLEEQQKTNLFLEQINS